MIGCDIVKVSRFRKKLDRWANKILTDLEKEEFIKKKESKIFYVAGRWAAKEAARKSLGTYYNISILNREDGSPYIKEYPDVSISISHEKEYCIAIILNIPK